MAPQAPTPQHHPHPPLNPTQLVPTPPPHQTTPVIPLQSNLLNALHPAAYPIHPSAAYPTSASSPPQIPPSLNNSIPPYPPPHLNFLPTSNHPDIPPSLLPTVNQRNYVNYQGVCYPVGMKNQPAEVVNAPLNHIVASGNDGGFTGCELTGHPPYHSVTAGGGFPPHGGGYPPFDAGSVHAFNHTQQEGGDDASNVLGGGGGGSSFSRGGSIVGGGKGLATPHGAGKFHVNNGNGAYDGSNSDAVITNNRGGVGRVVNPGKGGDVGGSGNSGGAKGDVSKREDFIRKATFLTTRNRLREALVVYNEALEYFPNDSEILNCKGVCLRDLHQPKEAYQCYVKALESDVSNAGAWNNKGVIYKEREEYEKAIECYTTAMAIDPAHPSYQTAVSNLAVALTDLGTKLKSQNRHKEAIERYKQARETDPSYSPCLYNLGVILSELGEFEQAMRMYGQAIKLNPRYVEAYNNMGAICKNIGQLYPAIMYYERALQVNPNFEMAKGNIAVALTDLGTQVKMQGNFKEGSRLYKKALVYNPSYGDAYYNLGVAYGEQFKYDKALVYYQLAVNFNPRCAEAFNNLGVIYKDKENLDKAIFYYEKALEVNPDFAQTLNNIGVIYTVVGKMTEAYEFTRRAISVNPNYAEAYNNLGVLYRDQGDVALAVKAYEKSISIDPNARNALQNRLLALNYLDGVPVRRIYEVSKEWGNLFLSTRQPYTSWKVDRNPNRVLKIGYIGPDFFTHSVSYFIHAPLKYHDPSKVDVTVYANVVREDDKTVMFKKLVPKWKYIFGVNEKVVAKMIRDDQIDILIELTGHTANNRLDVMAWKPAPVQVTWIGYPNTTGLSTIDYRISDALVDPPASKQPIVEELVRMPDCFLCYTPAADIPAVTPPPALESHFVTFGSFNNLAKMGPQVIRLWVRVLKAVPNSRLLIKAKSFANSTIQKKYTAQFEMEGISADRLDLLGLLPVCSDHLKTYSLMDIALDTFPYAGTTTTCESLIMGVPVVALNNDSNHAHNVGISLLTTVGMPELVARTEDEYVDIAVKLAGDLNRLVKYRESLRRNMLESPLGDGPRFTKNLELEYQKIFRRWCEKGGDYGVEAAG